MIRLSILLALACAASACNNSSSGATSFDATVTNLIQNGTDDTSDPLEVNGKTFAFPRAENAFDDILPPDTGAVVPQ